MDYKYHNIYNIYNEYYIIYRQKSFYEKIKDQVYFIGNLDQLINQCFFRRFATIDFGYLYYGIWNMFISFCCTGYHFKQKDIVIPGLKHLEYHSDSHSNISVLSTNSSSSSIFAKRNGIFTQNKHNSFIDIQALKKHHSFKYKLKRSFSDNNVKGLAKTDKEKIVSTI